MTMTFTPERWAYELTHLLNAAFGEDRFPVNVTELAQEFSSQRFPKEPISRIVGDDLPGFDGALFPAPAGKKGWGIFYNDRIRSKGRINFTLGHEFGHYLLHREIHPEGIRCGEQDVVRWDSQYGQIEHQANLFAANLLMPLDDFRRQIDATIKPDIDMISHCADRYEVSLIAASLRWLSYTTRRALVVVSRDGFVLWSRSSQKALKSRAYIKTAGRTVPVPNRSLAAQAKSESETRNGHQHDAGVWFDEPVLEMAIHSEYYDFVVSLLLLEETARYFQFENEPPDIF